MKQALTGLVGEGFVLDDAESLESFARDESFVLPIKPRYVVRPGTEDEVQKLVLWANDTGTSLVPVSSGAPHFYGDTVPSVPGAVMVDLGRLDRIRRIDRRNRMVVIEPGVTYAQLQPELANEGMRVTPPLLPRANKSVVAGLLERQPTLIPRYNYALPEPLRNCGVIWGDGQKFFTGDAGWGPPDLEAQWAAGGRQVDPKGPLQTDFYRLLTGAQGTLGLVIWASVKCELLADHKKTLFVTAERLEDLVDLCYRLTRLRLGDELFIVNDAYLGCLVAGVGEHIPSLRAALSPWTLVVRVGGRQLLAEEKMAVAEKDVAAETAHLGLRLLTAVPGVATARVDSALDGLAGEPHWKLRYKGSTRDIFFSTPLDQAPRFLATMLTAAGSHKYPAADVGVYLQPQHQGVTHHCEFSLPFDPADKASTSRLRDLYTDASTRLIQGGAYFSRPYGEWAGPVYNRDGQSTSALRAVKKILDPNNVLNPGKLCF